MLLRRAATYLPPLLVGLLAVPFIVRQNSWWEWTNAFWLLERQAAHVEAHGLPTFFLHVQSGAYNPFYVFYAGPMFTVLAYPAAVFGAWPVFSASIVLAIVCGYLGIWWAARNLGLSAPVAVLPGLIFATTPYVLSEMYGRGAWAELVAVNAVAVLLGALTALLWHPERNRLPAYAALVAAAAAVAGTHNLTLMMAAAAVPLLVLVILPTRPSGTPVLPLLARAGAAAALGVGLTAAWLLPNLWFGPDTWIAQASVNDQEFGKTFGQLHLSNVLSPLPNVPDEFLNRWVYGQAPSIAMAWAVLAFALVFVLGRRGSDSRRFGLAVAGIAVVALGLLALITNPSWWLHFPRLLRTIQFPFRLIPYLAMLTALATIIGLVALRGTARRWMTGVLVVAVAIQVAGGVYVVTESQPSGSLLVLPAHPRDIPAEVEPTSFASADVLVQAQFRVLKRPYGDKPNHQPTTIDLGNIITGDHGRFEGAGRVGDRTMVPVVWSPFVRVTGDARIAGRDSNGMAMLAVTRTDAAGRWRAEAGAAHPWQVVLGRLISLLSALVIAAYLIVALLRWRRRRRAGGPAAVATPEATDPRPAVGV